MIGSPFWPVVQILGPVHELRVVCLGRAFVGKPVREGLRVYEPDSLKWLLLRVILHDFFYKWLRILYGSLVSFCLQIEHMIVTNIKRKETFSLLFFENKAVYESGSTLEVHGLYSSFSRSCLISNEL